MADAAVALNQPGGRRRRGPLTSAWTGYVLAGPALLVMIAIFLYPLGYSFVMSFFRWDLSAPSAPFIGLNNYKETFASPLFQQSLRNQLIFTAATIAIEVSAGMGVAVLDQRQDARPSGRANAAAYSADDRASRRRPELPLALQFPIRLHRRAARRSPSACDPLALGSELGARLDHHRRRLAEYAAHGAALPGGPAIAAARAAGGRGCRRRARPGRSSGTSRCR